MFAKSHKLEEEIKQRLERLVMSSNEWREVKLGEIVDIEMGQSPKSEFYNTEGLGVPFTRQ